MDEKQLNEILSKLSAENQKELTRQFSDMKNGFITAEQFKSAAEKFASADDVKKFNDNIETLAIEIKKLRESGAEGKQTLKSYLAGQMENLKKLASREIKSLTLDIKAEVLRTSITSDTAAMRLNDIGQIATKRITLPSIMRNVSVSANSHGVIRYFDQSTATRNADTRAESTAAPESVLAWTEYSLALEKILDTLPVSHEALTDVDFISNEINNFLSLNVALKEESQMYVGDGNAPNYEGLYTVYATDYTQAIAAADKALTGGVVDASLADLIIYVATKITNGKDGKYMPNYVLLNPVDFNRLRLKKDANNNYIIPPFMSPDGMSIGGMKVLESSLVTANTMLVGDFNWATYYQMEGYSLELGYGDGQFVQDIMLLKARKRGNVLVRNVDLTAFYKVTDITTRITDITA